jgi:hypothetical protein
MAAVQHVALTLKGSSPTAPHGRSTDTTTTFLSDGSRAGQKHAARAEGTAASVAAIFSMVHRNLQSAV